MDRGNGGFRLKWPWNWVVCGLFVAAAWYFIGIFSLLLVALFLWWQKKRHPDAVPQGGYCLDRTRKRLARLLCVKSLITLLLTAVFAVMALRGEVSQDFMTVYTVIIAFYFGTQLERATQKGSGGG